MNITNYPNLRSISRKKNTCMEDRMSSCYKVTDSDFDASQLITSNFSASLINVFRIKNTNYSMDLNNYRTKKKFHEINFLILNMFLFHL